MHFTVAVERMGEPSEFLDGKFGLNSRMRKRDRSGFPHLFNGYLMIFTSS